MVHCICRCLLGFGDTSHYLGYNALKDFFPSMSMKPNPNCDENNCRLRQAEYQVFYILIIEKFTKLNAMVYVKSSR